MENNNCISKCYNTNTYGINPIFLNTKKDKKPFCFDNILNRESISNCENNLQNTNNEEYLLPRLNFNESIVLNLVYDINNWTTCLDYCIKYKNIINKNTLKRIIEYSWISFYSTYKVNINNINKIYFIYLNKNIDNKMNKEIIAKHLYDIKNLDLDIEKLKIKVLETFEI